MTEVTCSGPEMIALYQLVKGFLAYTFQQNYAQRFSNTVLSKAESFIFVENTCHVINPTGTSESVSFKWRSTSTVKGATQRSLSCTNSIGITRVRQTGIWNLKG